MVDQLARGLFAAGHEVLLAAPADSTCPVPKVPRLLESAPPRMGQTVVELRYVIAAYAALRDVDMVHDHSTLGPLSVPGRGDTPVPATNHGPFDEELRPISAEMSRRGIGVVAISRHQASTGRGVRIAGVIHHGINVSAIRVGPATAGMPASWAGCCRVRASVRPSWPLGRWGCRCGRREDARAARGGVLRACRPAATRW